MEVSIITYGGIIQELWAPDRRGRRANVTLGFADLAGYTTPRGDPPGTPNPAYFGAIIGRYGNRIGGAQFALDGTTYQLDVNNGPEQPARRLPRASTSASGTPSRSRGAARSA